MHDAIVIRYVAAQARARDFYAHVLAAKPTVDVPGMTEFDLGGVSLGLMPFTDMAAIIPELTPARGQGCELYLRRPDAQCWLERIHSAGGRILSPLLQRSWGEVVGYGLDLDGHVLAIAQCSKPS